MPRAVASSTTSSSGSSTKKEKTRWVSLSRSLLCPGQFYPYSPCGCVRFDLLDLPLYPLSRMPKLDNHPKAAAEVASGRGHISGGFFFFFSTTSLDIQPNLSANLKVVIDLHTAPFLPLVNRDRLGGVVKRAKLFCNAPPLNRVVSQRASWAHVEVIQVCTLFGTFSKPESI